MIDKCIFKRIFGADWPALPAVLKKRYANCANSNDTVTCNGRLSIKRARWMKLLGPLLRLSKTLVPYDGEDIPVDVVFQSEKNSNLIYFNRLFHYPGKKPYPFHSRLEPYKYGQVIEWMKFGFGLKMRCTYADNYVMLTGNGYVWKLFGCMIPVPLHLILGRVQASETAVDETHFKMKLSITHPLFGEVFLYTGIFKLIEK